MRARLIVDTSNVAHLIAGLEAAEQHAVRGIHRHEVSLGSVVELLQSRGIEIVEIHASVCISSLVTTGVEANPHIAQNIINRDLLWLKRQARLSTIPVIGIEAGHDGHHEVAIDEMIAAVALIEANDIEVTNKSDDEIVLLFSGDADLDFLATYVLPVKLVLMSHFTSKERKYLRHQGTPFLHLSGDEIQSCTDTWSGGPVHETGIGDDFNLAPTPATVPLHTERLAIIDPYGIFCDAAASIGIARLPTIESTRRLLKKLGIPDPIGVVATIPRISFDPQVKGQLPENLSAWKDRDADLEELGRTYEIDNDPTTEERPAVIPLRRLTRSYFTGLDRRAAMRVAKRLSTMMVADLIHAVIKRRSDHIILLSDSPTVTFVHSSLRQLVGTRLDGLRVTRVGLDPTPIREVLEIVDGMAKLKRRAGSFIILTEEQIADLVNVSALSFGRELRFELSELTDAPSEETWRVFDFDAESGGFIIENENQPRIHAILAASKEVYRLNQHLQLDHQNVELRFNPFLPTCAPVLSLKGRQSAASGETPIEVIEAMILGRIGPDIEVDIDRDGERDARIPVAQDSRPFSKLKPALLGTFVTRGDRPTFIAAPLEGSKENVVVVRCSKNGRKLVGEIAGTHSRHASGPIVTLPGIYASEYKTGDLILAVDVAQDNNQPSWLALSSSLLEPQEVVRTA